MRRTQADMDTLVLISIGGFLCLLALPYVKSQYFLGYLVAAAGLLMAVIAMLRRRKL
jgi:hypothetical protein